MRKINFLTTVLGVAAAMLIGVNAYGQVGTTPVGNATDYVSIATQADLHVIEGAQFPLYAMPDPYYHPNYNPAGGNYSLNAANFIWKWDEASDVFAFDSVGHSHDNYVVVTAPANGARAASYPITVYEQAPAAFGGCTGGNQTINVYLYNQPTFALNGGDATYNVCAGDASLPTSILATIAEGYQNYRLVWNLTITTLDAAGNPEFYYTDQTGAGRSPAASPVYAVNHTEDGTTDAYQSVAAATAALNIMTVPGFPVINNGTRNASTVYTYTLVSINDQASRMGNYIALGGDASDATQFTYYPATAAADQIVIRVNPAPTTGPIYHISNAWAQ